MKGPERRTAAWLFSTAAALVCGVPAASAQGKPAPSNTVCIVSMQRVVEESSQGKAALGSLEADMQKGRVRVETLRAEVDKLRDELKRQSLILSGDALESKTLALQRKERDLGMALGEMKQEFMRKNNASVAKVMERTKSVLERLNRERGCRFVLERGEGFVAYAAERIEITDAVIKEMNKAGDQ